MNPEDCAKKVIQKSLELDGTIDDEALMEVVARVCGKPNSVSLSAASASSSARSLSKRLPRKPSMGLPRRSQTPARSASLGLPRGMLEHRTSRPKSAKHTEQMLFEGLRRQVADAMTVGELEGTIGRIEEALDDGALRIPRETARLEGLIKKADSRLSKDPNLKE
jgi:hypothetical protein